MHAPPPTPDALPLTYLTPEPQRWLWPRRIPCGALTLLTGDPGVGKSLLAIDVAARITTAAPWPDGQPHSDQPADVIYVGGEDDLLTTVIPRLTAAGGDPRRVFALRGVRGEPSPRNDDRRCAEDTSPFNLRRHH